MAGFKSNFGWPVALRPRTLTSSCLVEVDIDALELKVRITVCENDILWNLNQKNRVRSGLTVGSSRVDSMFVADNLPKLRTSERKTSDLQLR